MKKVFIDGAEGTTGLKIFERFADRSDVELLKIDSELRKDVNERKRLINMSDVTFLCLPDAAAIEAATLVENPNTVLIDTSTAHRTDPEWDYGFAELGDDFRSRIASSKRISNPGCHATGFVSLVYPLIKAGILKKDAQLCSFSLTGYSGGGKKKIAEYEAENRSIALDAPTQYKIDQKHKHLKEMQVICGIDKAPLFSPIIDDIYSGMETTVFLYPEIMNIPEGVEDIRAFLVETYKKQYAGSKIVKVSDLGAEKESMGDTYAANYKSGKDDLEIFVNGNDERIIVTSLFDNLGKGASGAAIQNMNIVLGLDETTGLVF